MIDAKWRTATLSFLTFIAASPAIGMAPPVEDIGTIIQATRNTSFFQKAVATAGGWDAFRGLRDVTMMVPDDSACPLDDMAAGHPPFRTADEARSFVERHTFKGQINLQSLDRNTSLGVRDGERIIAHWVAPDGKVTTIGESQSTEIPSLAGASYTLKITDQHAYIGHVMLVGSSGAVGLGGSVFIVRACEP